MRNAPPYHPPQDPLNIIHCDAHLLVLDKPSGLLSVPGRQLQHADSLASRAMAEYPDARIAHRLDMATSGVMVMPRTASALRNLSAQFAKRIPQKTYLAIVAGCPAAEEGIVDVPLILDWPNRPLQKIDHETGKPALTRWRTLKPGPASLLELTPETGRTHQLRVHMAHIGHPILGDDFYAPDPQRLATPRLMLHAAQLTINHPHTGEPVTFIAQTPDLFAVDHHPG